MAGWGCWELGNLSKGPWIYRVNGERTLDMAGRGSEPALFALGRIQAFERGRSSKIRKQVIVSPGTCSYSA